MVIAFSRALAWEKAPDRADDDPCSPTGFKTQRWVGLSSATASGVIPQATEVKLQGGAGEARVGEGVSVGNSTASTPSLRLLRRHLSPLFVKAR